MKRNILCYCFLACLLLFFSCKKEKDNEMTRIEVRMTDAPGNFNAVILNIKEIIVKTNKGDHSFPLGSKPFDILKYRSGEDTLLAEGDIPTGKISQVRLVLNDAGNVVVIDSNFYDLKTPSGQQSGVKLNVHDELMEGITYQLLLDFDAAKSIVQTGSGKYILKPVIRAVAKATTGGIKGIVNPAEAYPKVYAIAGTDSVGTIADSLGNFNIHGLSTATYSVYVESANGYAPAKVNNVNVTVGTIQDVGTITVAK